MLNQISRLSGITGSFHTCRVGGNLTPRLNLDDESLHQMFILVQTFLTKLRPHRRFSFGDLIRVDAAFILFYFLDKSRELFCWGVFFCFQRRKKTQSVVDVAVYMFWVRSTGERFDDWRPPVSTWLQLSHTRSFSHSKHDELFNLRTWLAPSRWLKKRFCFPVFTVI